MEHLAGGLVGPDDPHDLGADRLLGLVGRGADVMRPVDAGLPDDGGPELAARWRGTVHRFTWGAGIEAMRPRSETVQ